MDTRRFARRIYAALTGITQAYSVEERTIVWWTCVSKSQSQSQELMQPPVRNNY